MSFSVKYARRLSVALFIMLNGCGGGASSTGSASAVPLVAAPASSAPSPATVGTDGKKFVLTTQSQKLSLLPTQNYAGEISIRPAAGAPEGTLLQANVSETQAVAAKERVLKSGFTRTPLYSVQLSTNANFALAGFPQFSISSPTFSGVDPKTLTYQVYDDVGCAFGLIASAAATSIVNDTATFDAVTTPFTLQANHTYTFVFYKTLPHILGQALIMTTLPKENAVVALGYDSDGKPNIVQRISGSGTGLDHPIDVAIAPHGEIYVLNGADATDFGNFRVVPTHQSIVEFLPTANGNAMPIATINDINTYGAIHKIGVSNSGTLYVNYYGAYSNYDGPIPSRGQEPAITVSSIAGGYFTIGQGGIRSAAIGAEGEVLYFAVSPDDRVGYETYSYRFSAGGNNSSGPGSYSSVTRYGNIVEKDEFPRSSALAFNPADNSFVRSTGNVVITSDRSLPKYVFATQSPSIEEIAYSSDGELYVGSRPAGASADFHLYVYANPFISLPADYSVPESSNVFADRVIDVGALVNHSQTSGLAIGTRD